MSGCLIPRHTLSSEGREPLKRGREPFKRGVSLSNKGVGISSKGRDYDKLHVRSFGVERVMARAKSDFPVGTHFKAFMGRCLMKCILEVCVVCVKECETEN
jgi:hypothetical protein